MLNRIAAQTAQRLAPFKRAATQPLDRNKSAMWRWVVIDQEDRHLCPLHFLTNLPILLSGYQLTDYQPLP